MYKEMFIRKQPHCTCTRNHSLARTPSKSKGTITSQSFSWTTLNASNLIERGIVILLHDNHKFRRFFIINATL